MNAFLWLACAASAQVFYQTPVGVASGTAISPSTGTLTQPATGAFSQPTAPFNQRPFPVYPYQLPGGGFDPGGTMPPPNGPGTTPPQNTPGTTPPQNTPDTPPPPGALPPQTRWDTLRRLDEQNFDSRRRLAALYAQRRKALVDGAEWTAASRSERKAKLGALKDEFSALEERLRAQYRRRRAEIVLGVDPGRTHAQEASR